MVENLWTKLRRQNELNFRDFTFRRYRTDMMFGWIRNHLPNLLQSLCVQLRPKSGNSIVRNGTLAKAAVKITKEISRSISFFKIERFDISFSTV